MQAQAKSTWRASPPVPAREGCTLCQGTGWQLLPASGTCRARRCSCAALSRIVKLKEQVCIPTRFEHCSLDNFHPFTFSQSKALLEARRFATKYPHLDKGLFFAGGPGVGKTHLAVGIVSELMQRFHDDILFVDFLGLMGRQRTEGLSPSGQDPDFARLRSVSLLVLDNFDLASVPVENLQQLHQILQGRLQLRKVTIYTGEKVERRDLLRGAAAAAGFAAHALQAAFLGRLVMQLVSEVRIIPLTGEDFRRRGEGEAPLF